MTVKQPLGKIQRDVLWALHSHGSWSKRSGWLWDTESKTERVMLSLMRRGLVTKVGDVFFVAPEPQPGGFEGSIDNRCPHCSFQPTNRHDFCEKHRPK